jgi:RNA recognition motif-containing protein
LKIKIKLTYFFKNNFELLVLKMSETKNEKKDTENEKSDELSLYVKNLGSSITSQELKNFFEKVSELLI